MVSPTDPRHWCLGFYILLTPGAPISLGELGVTYTGTPAHLCTYSDGASLSVFTESSSTLDQLCCPTPVIHTELQQFCCRGSTKGRQT